MRICLVSYEFPPKGGGEAVYTSNLAKGLGRLGHEIFLILPDEINPIEGHEGMTVISVPGIRKSLVRVSSFLEAAVARLPGLIRRHGLDLVHFTIDYPPFPIRIGGIDAPVVSTVHHLHAVEAVNMFRYSRYPILATPNLARLLLLSFSERSLLSQSDGVLAVSDFTRRSVMKHYGVPAAKVRVTYNSIGPSPILPSTPKDEHPGVPPSVLYVGRLERSKGVEYLVDAAAILGKKSRTVRFNIVGSDTSSYAAMLKRRVAHEGLEDMVFFSGRVDDATLREAYASCYLVVLPSMMEGMPTTLLEAMVAGKPCIATRVGGIPELVRNESTGLLVEPGDAGGLARAIEKVLGDPKAARSMGERGREVVEASFTVDKMCKDTEMAYEAVLAQHKSHTQRS